MTRSIKCKEPGCDCTILYEPEEIPGAQLTPNPSDKVVYLTCGRGHTHRYVVSS